MTVSIQNVLPVCSYLQSCEVSIRVFVPSSLSRAVRAACLHSALSHLYTMADKKSEALTMKREIGLIGGVALVSGSMIGSGIFMSPQFVLAYVGSPGASLVIWALSGLVAMCAALCYTELGTTIPESGGEFIYILRIYGPLPAFFAAFTFIIVVKPMGIAAMGFSIAEYVLSIVYPDCHPPPLLLKFTAASTILVVALVNTWNVQAAIRIQVVFMVAKVLALTAIVIGGFVRIFQSSSVIVQNLKIENSFQGTEFSLSAVGMAFYQGLWSYAGWYNLNYVTEELKRPEVKNASTTSDCFWSCDALQNVTTQCNLLKSKCFYFTTSCSSFEPALNPCHSCTR